MAAAEANNAALAAAVAAATATLDRIKPPPGVIVPPPGEMREVIEKTAGYAVRGGAGIEARLREHHSNNPKFSFVTNPDDAFHAYYEWRKEEYRAGRVTAVAAGRVGEGSGAAAAAAGGPADAAGAEGPVGPEKPPDFEFSARLPIMNARDVDMLRLTASFAAVHGRRFLTNLVQREVNNPQYQFLLPNHSLHNYFQRMVDQYTLINKDLGVAVPGEGEGEKEGEGEVEGEGMAVDGDGNGDGDGDGTNGVDANGASAHGDGSTNGDANGAAVSPATAANGNAANGTTPDTAATADAAANAADASAARLATLRRNADDRFSILLRAKQRIAYAQWAETQRKKEAHAKDVEKEELARIDWTNFAVLETIVFSEADDNEALPPPTSLNDLQYASLEEKSRMSMAANRMIEEAFPFETPVYGK
ncbi:pre-mRNA splicing factor [Niveomyces insectorum RCEF 264]|uniref:Pre-mRNA splicing factor n=1 Tax=Niveomyces insectorum RCEF 264 TaxID=1081102 RepID=A0A167W460_9HYPO|nr:pre-mRNA splicing factor [Niveomyces insectorum RCEF 264]